MTAKEYLNRAYYIDRKIILTLTKAAQLRQSLYGKGVSYDGINVKQSCDNNAMAKVVETVADYERQADTMIDDLLTKRKEIETAIECISEPLLREVLERRYLIFQPWQNKVDRDTGDVIAEGITESMKYSRSQIMRMHKKALAFLADKIKDDTK